MTLCIFVDQQMYWQAVHLITTTLTLQTNKRKDNPLLVPQGRRFQKKYKKVPGKVISCFTHAFIDTCSLAKVS